MSKAPGTPLPGDLSGVEMVRVIRLDSSLFYLVSGALEYLTDREPFEQTGTLTPDDARIALGEMVWNYYNEVYMAVAVGVTMIWWTDTAPEGWLFCDSSVLHDGADYPDLYAVLGSTFNLPGDAAGSFRTPDLADVSPMGVGSVLTGIGGTAGELTHTLTESEMPSHNHQQTVNNTTPAVRFTSGGSVINQSVGATSSSSTPLTTQNRGGGEAHNNLHPVMGVRFIIYAGV